MRTPFIAICFVLFFSFSPAYSATLSELVGDLRAGGLRSGTSIKEVRTRTEKPGLVPRGGSGVRLETEIARFEPNVLVEALYLFPKPSSAAGRSWNEGERRTVFNLLQSLSTLKGIEYFSASRGRMRVFYESSYVVDGPEGKSAVPDPLAAAVPERSTIYAVQKDLSFGENRYRYEYVATSSDISFVQLNLTTMVYAFVPVLGKERLKTVVLVTDTDEGYLLYAASAARTTLLPGLEDKIKNSFSNRADAIYRWFSSRADAMGLGK
jgi:hypothetical protein